MFCSFGAWQYARLRQADIRGPGCLTPCPAAPAACRCSVNDAVLNSPTNPLLVVNSLLQHTLAQQRKARTNTQAPASPKLMLSGVAVAGTGTAGQGSRLGSPKGGSASTRTVGPLTGRSALSASAAAGGAAAMTGISPAAAAAVAGGLLMSPRSSTAPAAATRAG